MTILCRSGHRMEKILHQLLILGEILFSADALSSVIHLAEFDDIQITVLSDIGIGHGVREPDPCRGQTHDLPIEAFEQTVLRQAILEPHLGASEHRAFIRHKTEQDRLDPANIDNNVTILVVNAAARSIRSEEFLQLSAVHLVEAVGIGRR